MEENSVDLDLTFNVQNGTRVLSGRNRWHFHLKMPHIFDVSGFTIFSYQVNKIWWILQGNSVKKSEPLHALSFNDQIVPCSKNKRTRENKDLPNLLFLHWFHATLAKCSQKTRPSILCVTQTSQELRMLSRSLSVYQCLLT